jgi:hypothetical protein
MVLGQIHTVSNNFVDKVENDTIFTNKLSHNKGKKVPKNTFTKDFL